MREKRMERNFGINEQGHNIRCKLYYQSIPDIRRVVVFCHGFAGHKDNRAAQKFAEKILSKYHGIAVLVFNWPCHGDDVKKKLLLRDCVTYLDLVVRYVKEQYHTEEIYAYATSFGGYMVLKYIMEQGNPFVKIVLRCPAVNMYDSLCGKIMNAEDGEKLRKGKNTQVGFDRKIEISPQFLQDLQESDIQKLDYLEQSESILILHGTKDEVIPFDVVQKFADDNLIEFVPVPNADHRFQNPDCMDFATKQTLSFYGF